MCELPTGYGKTYNVVHAMRDYVLGEANTENENNKKKKIIYLTSLKKNIFEEDLKKVFGNEEEYKKNVLRIRSNFDEVKDKIRNIDIPSEMQSKSYFNLVDAVDRYNKACKEQYRDKYYVSELEKKVNKCERDFRHEIQDLLHKKFKDDRKKKLNAIKKDKKYKWIAELYPAVFVNEYSIILMSISKFMAKNSVIVDKSYDFLQADLVKNSIIFIDEFDATKETIKNVIIEKSIALCDDYFKLFMQIYRSLILDDLSNELKQAMSEEKKYSVEHLIQLGDAIIEKYHANLSLKVKDDFIDKKQAFLFNDGSFHTLLNKNAGFIRAAYNDEDNKIDIFFENKENYYKNKDIDKNNKKDINLYSLITAIDNFISIFRFSYLNWADKYRQNINAKRESHDREMSGADAVSTILQRLNLSDKQIGLLTGEMCDNSKKNINPILEDRTFYQKGMEHFEFEDSDAHNDYTDIKMVKVYDTPEKIMQYLAERAVVFGISASAEISTVVGNYDLNYLRKTLKESYHKTPKELKERVSASLNKKWTKYENGEINIHTEIVKNKMSGFDAKEYCKAFVDDEYAQFAVNIISTICNKEYMVVRYCNIFKAMSFFASNDKVQSMLYLGMALPKLPNESNGDMDLTTIERLFELAKCANGRENEAEGTFEKNEIKNEKVQKPSGAGNISLFILTGNDYEEKKQELQDRLYSGERIFVMSSYATIGAGQNLIYKIPKNNKVIYLDKKDKTDSRYVNKDFDALYLGDITHLAVNTYQEDKISAQELLKMLFQVEELSYNGEISRAVKEQMIKLAFRSYAGDEQYTYNALAKTRSVRMLATRAVLQAVGRMCRTFVKSPDIYIFIESELLEKLYAGELKKRVLPPELKAIVELREQFGTEYSDEENRLLNLAEKISSEGAALLNRILSKKLPLELRSILCEIALKYLGISVDEYENGQYRDYFQKFYITAGRKVKEYIYIQNNDYADVIVDFNGDKNSFKNSSRAQRISRDGDIVVCEVSEKDSKLQQILKYPGMKEHFEKLGYATSFSECDYVMTPVFYHNIYKGAIGEVAGKYILNKELGIQLKPIEDTDIYEVFDYEMSDGVYVDFKNWNVTFQKDRDEMIAKNLKKLGDIGGKRVYIINVIQDKEWKPSKVIDSRIVEIPMLIDKNGNVSYENLHMILQEDF